MTGSLLDAVQRQAASCAHIGSPLYARLLAGIAADVEAGGISAEVLDGVSERPVHDAVPLRYLATAHRLALVGAAPDLAARYPSCGGAWDGSDPTPAFLAVVAAHRAAFDDGVLRNVQTNEVGRAAVLAAGFSLVSRRTGLPLRTDEIGASAGLLSHWDRFRYDTGSAQLGPTDAEVRFGPDRFVPPGPTLDPNVVVLERRCADVAPVDVTTDDGRVRMLSFVWPDQLERFARLDAAIAVARAHPLVVEAADAGEWLTDRLAGGTPVGAATVVFHSIVWQYLPAATREGVRRALATAGAQASPDRPLVWMRMEPATREHADLRLTTWSGGDPVEELIAEVGYHGADVRWLLPDRPPRHSS